MTDTPHPQWHAPVTAPAGLSMQGPGGTTVVPADAGLRLGARFLDGIVTLFITLASGLVVTGVFAAINGGNMDNVGPEYGVPMLVVIIGTPFLYEWLQISRWGATLGKRAVGIKVVRAADGGPVPKGRAVLRALCFSPGIYYAPNYLPVLGQLNILWLLWDRPLRQCLHDKAAKTMVVRGRVTQKAPVQLPGSTAFTR
ncbi:RDD family protein [Actinomadura sp. 9N215]|uniref:RDD family protein n=1 Tax=Actinomadura sp. 9N215 TaxID=3375150 RepID=UPI0037981DFC